MEHLIELSYRRRATTLTATPLAGWLMEAPLLGCHPWAPRMLLALQLDWAGLLHHKHLLVPIDRVLACFACPVAVQANQGNSCPHGASRIVASVMQSSWRGRLPSHRAAGKLCTTTCTCPRRLAGRQMPRTCRFLQSQGSLWQRANLLLLRWVSRNHPCEVSRVYRSPRKSSTAVDSFASCDDKLRCTSGND